jgi:2,5-furandicarboxylate decarboxylase 1
LKFLEEPLVRLKVASAWGSAVDLRGFLGKLERRGLLLKYQRPVSTKFEIASILRRNEGRPVLFQRVKGFPMPVVGNLYSSQELLAMALGVSKGRLRDLVLRAIEHPREPRVQEMRGYEELDPDLSKFPILRHHPCEGGPYLTASIVIASHRRLGMNASYHRMMVLDKQRVAVRIAPRHLERFIQEGTKEVAICLGAPPSVALAAAISVELSKSELAIANAMSRTPMLKIEGHLVPPSEIVMLAEATGERHPEGPFLDLMGLPDEVRMERVFRIKKIFTRPNPIYQAILPGGSEHATLMGYPREVAIYREVSKVCKCLEVRLTPGGRYWLHCLIKIRKENPDDGVKALEAAFRAHPSLKHAWVVDEDIDIEKPEEVEWAMATRFQAKRALITREEPGSSLDPSASEDGVTSKAGFDLTMPLERRERFLKVA